MHKIVALFDTEEKAIKAGKELINHNISDYRLNRLSKDYEQQIRQEIFLRPIEVTITLWGALGGAFLFGFLFYLLAQNNSYGLLIGRLLAGGTPEAVFTGASFGLALGALLAGVFALSMSVLKDYTGYWQMVLYCKGPYEKRKAADILRSAFGIFP